MGRLPAQGNAGHTGGSSSSSRSTCTNRRADKSGNALEEAFGEWASWQGGELPLPAESVHRTEAVEPVGAVALFETFRTAEDLSTILAAFAKLYRLAVLAPKVARGGGAVSSSTYLDNAEPRAEHRAQLAAEPEGEPQASQCLPPWAASGHAWRYAYEPIRVLLAGHWKAKQLWAKLDARCGRPEYTASACAEGRLRGKRIVVVGAGPSGLRAAIELRLLGAQVTVLERRTSFTRLNRLHLWHWCGEELKALGARCLEPPPLDFGSDPDLLHVGIAELQTLLLKTALLLGVQVLLGVSYCGVKWVHRVSNHARGSWAVRVHRGTSGPAKLDEADELLLGNVAVVVGAGGLSCGVGQGIGMETVEVGSLRVEEAIGLVCNFRASGQSDRSLRSFALARQFYGKLFARLDVETGAELENVVYTRSKASHYFVMTPTRRCLERCGVLKDPLCKPALASHNLDRSALNAFVRRIVAFPFKEGEPTLPTVLEKDKSELRYADGGPQLFDFSRMRRMAEGLAFVAPPAKNQEGIEDDQEVVSGDAPAEGGEHPLLVVLAGDALVEPFWPEGLGVVRGFFGALDASWAALRWASGAPQTLVSAEFAAAYGQLKSLGAQSRRRVLRDDEAGFGLAPSTRYRIVGHPPDAM